MIDFKTRYRQYKISQVLGEDFDDKDKDFLKILNHIKSTIINPDFKQFKDDKSPNLIWYGLSRDNIYIEQDLKNNKFWLDHHKIWSFF